MVSRVKTTAIVFLLYSVIAMCRGLLADNILVVGHALPTVTVPIDEIEHTQWTNLLSRYVDTLGSVSYARWHQSVADRKALSDYLNQLSEVDTDAPSSRDAKLAFWINAYNALTIAGILHHYPINSIREIADETGGFNIWNDYRLHVDGKSYSLDQIEHDILRQMNEPRIHFAIVCASKSCPVLASQAYTSDGLHQQLTQSAKKFLAKPENLSQDSGSIQLSSLFDWYRVDFGKSDQDVVDQISPWFPKEFRSSKIRSDSTLRYLDYDWSLNESASTPRHP